MRTLDGFFGTNTIVDNYSLFYYILFMFTDISNFSNTGDYLPLLNGVLITDLFVIFLLNTQILKSTVLRTWYDKYNLSAVISDVLIIMIALIITRAIYSYMFNTFSLLRFVFLAVIVQVIHDSLFYFFFRSVPRGVNQMLDTFKDYAKEASFKAILADSGMVILACLISSFLANQSLNTNSIVLIVSVYLLPYLLYN